MATKQCPNCGTERNAQLAPVHERKCMGLSPEHFERVARWLELFDARLTPTAK